MRFASIGMGVQGCELLQESLHVPGAKWFAVCDHYDSRHTAAQEAVKKNVPSTRNYKEILDRKDVDAIFIAVTDHQHCKVFIRACAAGKDVYCEKPMPTPWKTASQWLKPRRRQIALCRFQPAGLVHSPRAREGNL